MKIECDCGAEMIQITEEDEEPGIGVKEVKFYCPRCQIIVSTKTRIDELPK